MRWTEYAIAMLVFSAVTMLVLTYWSVCKSFSRESPEIWGSAT